MANGTGPRRGGFRLESSLELGRAPAEVFAILADTAHFQAVDPALRAFSPGGPLSLGLKGTFEHRRGVMTARTTWTVTELDAPRSLTVEIRGPGYGMTESATLEAVGPSTRATFVDVVWPTSAPGRLLVALSGGIMRRDLRARARRLRAILEAPPARAPHEAPP